MGPEGGPDRLFAPWRFPYVSQEETFSGCIFCRAAEGGKETLTLARGKTVFALLNKFPYTSGHAMVAPLRHTAALDALEAETLGEMMSMAQRVLRALGRVYRPDGFNLGMNLGEIAGAGIVDHLHLHVVPRWRGDTNFMTVSGGVRVIPEDLAQTWEKVHRALEEDHA